MQLFTTYGVQSSVPPKTVVAVISEDAGQSTFSTYTGFSEIINQERYYNASGATGTLISSSGRKTTPLIAIQNDSLVFSTNAPWMALGYWDSNQTYIGYVSYGYDYRGTIIHNGSMGDLNNNNNYMPSNAAYFSYTTISSAVTTATYEVPGTPSQTVTFFDEYPNGTQIGNAVAVTGTSPITVDPPATYKIRQLVFE